MFIYSWFKDSYLRNTDYGTGFATSLFVGVLTACILIALGIAISLGFHSPFFFIVSILASCPLAPTAGVMTWNEGLFEIETYHRAIPRWFGRRQKGAEYEMAEGKGWKLPFFMKGDPVAFNMRQKEAADIVINVITKNLVTIPTKLKVEWMPRQGELYDMSNIEDIPKALEGELEEVARAFGGSRTDVQHLVDNDLGEAIRKISVDYLNRRSNGEVNNICIPDDDSTLTDAFFTRTGDAPPWGIEIINVTVTGYDLPKGFSDTATLVEEAKKRAGAGKIINEAMKKAADPWIERHVNPTAAMAMAADLVNPAGARNIQTNNIAGYEGIARAFVDGLLVVMGKKDTPTTPAPEVAAAAQAAREESEGDQQP